MQLGHLQHKHVLSESHLNKTVLLYYFIALKTQHHLHSKWPGLPRKTGWGEQGTTTLGKKG